MLEGQRTSAGTPANDLLVQYLCPPSAYRRPRRRCGGREKGNTWTASATSQIKRYNTARQPPNRRPDMQPLELEACISPVEHTLNLIRDVRLHKLGHRNPMGREGEPAAAAPPLSPHKRVHKNRMTPPKTLQKLVTSTYHPEQGEKERSFQSPAWRKTVHARTKGTGFKDKREVSRRVRVKEREALGTAQQDTMRAASALCESAQWDSDPKFDAEMAGMGSTMP
ncbi:hypothetical protein R3P38DRAFT_3173603 [Favolaschia claudopus]|uniref:Uncharacterized protein n=1 Tax=Favolaschia claudopus TaxID=2862362 RepID=A0AAW0DGX9_9AGAR